MNTRYCMYCGMPIPRRADICPECGNSLKFPIPQNHARRYSQENTNQRRTKQAGRNLNKKQVSGKNAALIGLGVVAVFFASVFGIMRTARMIENARSRHRENEMDAQRQEKERAHPHISIPDLSMPDFSFPDIQLPEPPQAEFAVTGYEIQTDPAGKTVLYVNVSYTNKSEKEQCFLVNYKISVEQDGENCRQTAVDPNRENHLTDLIQPDETAQITEAFFISTEKETNVTLTAYLGGEPYLVEAIIPRADGTVAESDSD